MVNDLIKTVLLQLTKHYHLEQDLRSALSGVLLFGSMIVVLTLMVGPLILVKERLMLSVSRTLELDELN